jgi:hypothetical protein
MPEVFLHGAKILATETEQLTPHERRNACGWSSGTPTRTPIALVIFQTR